MAITCTKCGYTYNSDSAIHCSICNEFLQSGTNIRSASISAGIQRNRQKVFSAPPAQVLKNQPSSVSLLEGRISHIERNDEIPQRDIFRILAKLLIGILFLIPYMGLFITTACFSFVFAIIGFRSLSQLFNPFIWSTSIFELLEIIVLRRIKGTDTVPIYRGMVEDTNSQEYSFIFRGPMRAGNLVAGHNVRLFGQRERGTFVTQNGMDMTSNSEIISDYRNPWRLIFYFILALYIIIGLGVCFNLPEIAGYYG